MIPQISDLFPAPAMLPRKVYARLSRLCHGLDLVFPGEPALKTLREIQLEYHRAAYPARKDRRPAPKPSSEIEDALASLRHHKTGGTLARATLEAQRKVLSLHSRLLTDAGIPFSFTRPALDVFADHTFRQLENWTKRNEEMGIPDEQGSPDLPRGWSRRSAMAMCLRLSRHIVDEDLRREWVAFGLAFGAEANRRGDLKMKERSLSARPVTLEGLCWLAVDMLHKLPEQTDVQARRRRSAVLGALGILLFYPLRKGDLLRLRFHRELIRAEGKWCLRLHATQKTNEYLPPLILPAETTPLIDLALTNGAPLHTVGACYAAAKGQYLISSPRSSGAYNPSAFTSSFSELVGQPPHTLRTIWCDELIARGADRMTVKVMLQHKRLLSQGEYEVMAQKIRRNRALEALRSFAQEL